MSLATWTKADSWGLTGTEYDRFSEDFSDALLHCVRRLNPGPEEIVLDVATGTGWSARLAAKNGSRVIGLDYSEDLIRAARLLAGERQLSIQFDVGDAQQLPYADQSFDAVMSTFGVMFAEKPERVASELARVIKPGGRLALAVWGVDSTLALLSRQVVMPFSSKPKEPMPSPFAWGAKNRLIELLGNNFDLKFDAGCSYMRQSDGEAVWQLWQETHGLTVARLASLSDDRKAQFKQAFIRFHENYRTDVGLEMPRDYIIAIGVKK